ncbi:MAG: phosphoenolpyruvate--protein phosphotransferase, partial [Spirochaetaceae bacterium]|nr:phosphoenolpyruvate--protein phosphotransferase [Spirochaetaceae bacterium]
MRELHGIAASPGTSFAPVLIFKDEFSSSIPSYPIMENEVESEYARYQAAVEQARVEVSALRAKAMEDAGEEQAAIFDAHLLMLDDPEVNEKIRAELDSSLTNVESIVFSTERKMMENLASAQDPYIQERVSDVHDVTRRIMGHLLNKERMTLADINRDVIVVARNLLPSDMVGMARGRIKGIAT